VDAADLELAHCSRDFRHKEDIFELPDLYCSYTHLCKRLIITQPDPQVHKVPSPPFTDDLRRQCRERLLGCLADLTRLSNVTQPADRAQRMLGVTSDREPWISRVLQTIRLLEQDSKHVELLLAFGSEDRGVLERSCNLVNLVTKLKKACRRRMFPFQFPS
jgi:hypothetical protein